MKKNIKEDIWNFCVGAYVNSCVWFCSILILLSGLYLADTALSHVVVSYKDFMFGGNILYAVGFAILMGIAQTLLFGKWLLKLPTGVRIGIFALHLYGFFCWLFSVCNVFNYLCTEYYITTEFTYLPLTFIFWGCTVIAIILYNKKTKKYNRLLSAYQEKSGADNAQNI